MVSTGADKASVLEGTAGAVDTGLACLTIIARLHGIAVDPAQILHEFGEPGRPFDGELIRHAANKLGLNTKLVNSELIRASYLALPAMAVDTSGAMYVIARVSDKKILIQDPLHGSPQLLSLEDIAPRWSGRVILFTSRTSIVGELSRFDFSWFIPAIVKYRKLLGEILIVSFFLQLISDGSTGPAIFSWKIF